MAKRRFFARAKSRATKAIRYIKSKRSRKSSSSSGSVQPLQVSAMAYGALRPYAVGLTAPVTDIVDNYIPTDIAQSLTMGTIAYFTAKNTSGMVREVAKKALTAENYEMGKAIGNKFMGTQTTNTNSTQFVIG